MTFADCPDRTRVTNNSIIKNQCMHILYIYVCIDIVSLTLSVYVDIPSLWVSINVLSYYLSVYFDITSLSLSGYIDIPFLSRSGNVLTNHLCSQISPPAAATAAHPAAVAPLTSAGGGGGRAAGAGGRDGGGRGDGACRSGPRSSLGAEAGSDQDYGGGVQRHHVGYRRGRW